MKKMKKLTLNKILAILLMPLLIIATALGLCIKGEDKSASALPAYPYSGYIGPIYDFDTLNYKEDKLNELASAILGSGKTINNLIDYIKSDALTSGLPISNKQITVAYGRYRASTTTQDYDPLVWMPVYMSTTADGQDAILTLYLGAVNGPRSDYEYGGFTQQGEYTTYAQSMIPSNMYGTSYLRANRLGNGGKYANYNADHGAGFSEQTAKIASAGGNNKYLDFLKYTETNYFGEEVTTMGYLYEDLVTPSQMAWQATESYKDVIGADGEFYTAGGLTVDGSAGGTAWENYKFPNEAYGTANGDYTNNNYDYSNKSGYDAWKEDKVWIPSLTEVGTGDDDGTTNTLNGLWKLTRDQKANVSAGVMNPTTAAWLRTPNTLANCYSMFTLEENGTVATRELSERNLQYRPAIHLNLSKIITKYRAPVNVPDVVSVQYNGAAQTLKGGEVDWMTNDVTVSFYLDREATKPTAAVDAGEYYMVVYLENPNDYFAKLPFAQKYKIVRFIVEKKQIGVVWTYDGNKPISIAMSSDSVIFNRDIIAGYVPEIGIKYVSTTGSGTTYYKFDDILKGAYMGEAYIIDDYKYNYVLSPDTVKDGNTEKPNPVKIGEPLKSNTFAVGRKEVDMPYFVGTDPGTLTHRLSYKGDQYVQIANVNPDYFTITTSSPLNKPCKFIGVSEQGYLTYKVSEVDDYTFNFKFKNTSQFTWSDSGYIWAPSGTSGTESNVDSADRVLTLQLRRAELDIEFIGLAAEWGTVATEEFSVAVHGIYAGDADNPVEISVYYMRAGQPSPINVVAVDGVYVLKNLLAGDYTMYASLAVGSAYLNNYVVPNTYKTQAFRVVQIESDFQISLIKWQYTHGMTTSGEYGFAEHDRESTALEFFYDGDFYQFSLTLGEIDLRDMYYVKAVYSGDKFVKDAGLYKITVNIKAYYENVSVEEVSCDFYFRIKPVKYNLSALEWDYDIGSPFTYNGARQRVSITADSLAGYPGLTVDYQTEGNRIDAATYTTKAIFKVSEAYATNYILPVEEDDTTYDGTFPFNCTWTIGKAVLDIEWKEADETSSSDITFIPTLKKGHEFVDYTYEKKDGSNWVAATELKADGAAETFRAIATVREEYANNYEILSNQYSGEFEIASGKQAVSVHYELDGETVEDGAEFKYTGSAIEFDIVVDSGGVTIDDGYTFKYYLVTGPTTRTELTGAPFDVGEYEAEVTATFNGGSYVSSGTPKLSFKIIKGDYDPKQMWWIYQHGETILAGRYDKDQEKWVDGNGREVEFSFEYDGTPHMLTLSLQQEFTDPADAITIDGNILGNSATAANDYTAVVNFNYNTARFNDPLIMTPGGDGVFPRTLSWKITKQKLDYNKVRWGYFTADGREHAFNFDEDSFRFTRDENGVVGYTVGLIGLPKGVQDLITYKTKDLNVLASLPELGNTRAAVGEYLTSFTISGTWTDPNYEDFDAATFPLTIPTTQIWKIKRRELSKIDYDGSWTKFDDRTHDVVDLCNIPYNELPYFKIEITLVDKLNNVYNDYEGYNGVENSLYHAGEYIINFYAITGEEETPIIYDSVRITVEKNTLNVTWSLDGDYPVVRVKDVYATDMVTTVYIRENGYEVPIAYVKSTDGSEKFTAEARVTDAYKRNIEINKLEPVEFYYTPFIADESTVAIKKPTITENQIEYTGEAITFVIDAWATYYSKYLYISDGTLTQTQPGTYYVVLRFYKRDDVKGIGNAYWEGSSSSAMGEYDRESYTLSFTILPPSKWALDYPQLETDYKQWTNDDLEFKIVNWVALSQYIDYEVFYDGESLGINIPLIFRRGGLYTLIFSFPEDSIGYWRDALEPRGTYMLQFNIFGDPDVKDEIRYPTLDRTSAEFDGNEKQFKIISWDSFFVQFVTLNCDSENVRITGGVITASIPGNYIITVTTKPGYYFEGGKTTYTLTIGITSPEGVETPISKPSFSENEKTWTGEELTFTIPGWSTLYAKDLELSCDDSTVVVDNEKGIIKVTNFGEYTIKVSIKDGSLVYWSGTDKDRTPIELKIKVDANVDENTAIPPAMKVPQLQYNGKEQTFELVNFDATKVTIVEGEDALKQKEVGEYTITLRLTNPWSLTNPDGVKWLDGTTEDIVLKFYIVPLKISDIGVGDDGGIVVIGPDGKPVPDVDLSDFIDVIYFDKDGNPVAKEDLVPGEKYTVKFVIKDQEKFETSIDDHETIRDKIDSGNSNGSFVIIEYKPSENEKKDDDDGGGFNPLWWIAIGAGILAVIAILGVIIGLATRKNGSDGYDDGYGYDDYYDDEDEEDDDYDDEYDDDYDDYDDYGDDYGYDDY